MMNKEVKLIGKIDFLDKQVEIYHDPYTDLDTISCTWQARNSDSYYKGIDYLQPYTYTDKIEYSKDAVIPEQTEKDREILPKFVIVGQKELDEKLTTSIKNYFESEHKFRNGKLHCGKV